jgi:primosomal protein N' (replication factor Y) (superfamily II helicase)
VTPDLGDAPTGAPPLRIARVVVEVEPLHLDRPFDYRVPDDLDLVAGQRVQVVFGGRLVRGLVVEVAQHTDVDPGRLREVRRAFGEHVWVRDEELGLLRWAADRFGAPLADVVRHALPTRTVEVERSAAAAGWFPPGAGRRPSSDPPPDAAALTAAWADYGEGGDRLREAVTSDHGSFLWRPLPGEDVAARLAELTQLCLAGGRDVLVVVPDPASPVADAVVAAAGDLAVDLRGGPSARVQYRRWLEARCGVARVVVGERGAAWYPLEQLGLAVVLDEASPALKERRSPRHHAREVVLERARRAGGVGLAVGTVPSAVAWRLLRHQRLTAVTPSREAERRARPRVQVVTDRPGQARARLPREAMRALREATDAGTYGVLLAGRRGEGRALVCASCGDRHVCPTCASSLTIVRGGPFCWGCGWRARRVAPCHACRSTQVVALAAGTARFATELQRGLGAPVAVLEGYAQPAPPPPAVLVMTRGSVLDAPPGPVGAVVLPDLDDALARPTLDAAEDALRLAVAVSGWTVHGRHRTEPGTVVVPTRDPDHHAVTALAAWDLGSFWRTEVSIRTPLRFPPVAHAMRLEVAGEDPMELRTEVTACLPDGDDVLGPVPVEGRQGLLIKSDDRGATLAALRPLRERWSKAGVEARLDVDPVDAL